MSLRLPPDGVLSKSKTLWVIFILAVTVRMVFISALEEGYYFADSARYEAAATRIVEYNNYPKYYDRAPLYPAFLAVLYSTIGEEIFKTRLVQAVMGGLIAVMMAIIGFRSAGYWVGAFAGLLWTIVPMGVFIAGSVYPTTILTLLLVLGVYCVLPRADGSRNMVMLIAGGLLFGFAALAKPVVMVSVGAVSLWLLVFRKDRRWLSASVFAIAAVIAITPWTYRQYQVHGKLIPIEARQLNTLTPWAQTKAEKERRARMRLAAIVALKKNSDDPEFKRKIAEALKKAEAKKTKQQEEKVTEPPPPPAAEKKDTLEMLRRVARRFPREFISFFELYPRRVGFLNQQQRDLARVERNPRLVEEMPFGSRLVMGIGAFSVSFLYVFALLGIRAMWLSTKARPYLALYLALVLSFALTYATTWGKIRYRIPVDPYIILMSAWGIFWAWGALFGVGNDLRDASHNDASSPGLEPR